MMGTLEQWSLGSFLVAGTMIGTLAMQAIAQEWWTQPWDAKVSPAIGVPANQRNKDAWYLPSVNDQGGTPEQDNQRDIAKSLGRIRKSRVQTVYRLNSLRDIAEVLGVEPGPMAQTTAKTAVQFDQAEKILQEAIRLQQANQIGPAREKIDQAKRLLAKAEATVETAMARVEAARRVQHLRNAAEYFGQQDQLADAIAQAERALLAEANARTGNLTSACRDVQKRIDALRGRLARVKDSAIRVQCRNLLDFYEYLLHDSATWS